MHDYILLLVEKNRLEYVRSILELASQLVFIKPAVSRNLEDVLMTVEEFSRLANEKGQRLVVLCEPGYPLALEIANKASTAYLHGSDGLVRLK